MARVARNRRNPASYSFAVIVMDYLRVIAEHGYDGAASTDHDCRSQAVSLFNSDSVACLDRTG
jgi:hypothetical protein